MVQANDAHKPDRPVPSPGYILDDSRQFRLHLLGKALDGLKSLALVDDDRPGEPSVEIPRVELAAIFELLSIHLDEATSNMPYGAVLQ